jgi:hypothetical protein
MSGLGGRVWAEARAKKERRAKASVFAATLHGVERWVFLLREGLPPDVAEHRCAPVLGDLRGSRLGRAPHRERELLYRAGLVDRWGRITSAGHAALAYFRRSTAGWAP